MIGAQLKRLESCLGGPGLGGLEGPNAANGYREDSSEGGKLCHGCPGLIEVKMYRYIISLNLTWRRREGARGCSAN